MYTVIKRFVTVTAVFLLLSNLGLNLTVKAATNDELQAQLNALIAQLQQIQQQQGGAQGQTGGSISSGTSMVAPISPASDCDVNRMTRTIRMGSRGKDVLCLQEFLIEEEFLRVSATGYFGSATNTAFKKWQASRGISVTGVFGSESRAAYIAAVNGGSGDSGTTPVPTPVNYTNYQTKDKCEQETGRTCQPWTCDYVPQGKTFEQVCPNGSYGWSPIAATITPAPMCAQVLRQCSDGSYVGYKAGTCDYKECPISTSPLPPPTKEVLSITGISPAWGPVGTIVYVSGTKFTQDTYVMVDGIYGQMITPQKSTICTQSIPGTCYTSLYFKIPSTLSVGTHTLQVSDKGGDSTVSNAVKLNVTEGLEAIPLPCGETSANGTISNPCRIQKLTLTSIMPALAVPGTPVKVYGSGFNNATFAMIDGDYGYTIQPNVITLSGSTYLSFVLPANLSYGNHSLQVGEKAGSALSNTVNFKVGSSVPAQTSPVIISAFNASHSFIGNGETITFTWSSNLTQNDISYYGGGCMIEGKTQNNVALYVTSGFKGASGQATYVSPGAATYTLYCTSGGKDGSPMATQQVVVNPSSGSSMAGNTSSAMPSCTLTANKDSYQYGETITFSWTSQNATYATFWQDDSGKDHLTLPGDKLETTGFQSIIANVIGNPSAKLLIYNYYGSNSCSATVSVSQ